MIEMDVIIIKLIRLQLHFTYSAYSGGDSDREQTCGRLQTGAIMTNLREITVPVRYANWEGSKRCLISKFIGQLECKLIRNSYSHQTVVCVSTNDTVF